jgi:MarR family transcriptional regulator, transcriptional regulator for hemolysin
MLAIKVAARDPRVEFADELSKVSRKMRTLFDARVKTIGLTLARARILMLLAKQEGMTQTELAEALEVENPTLVRLLDGLGSQNLIERLPVDGDRRAKQVALTAPGRALAAKVGRLADEFRIEILTDVSEADVKAATRLLRGMSRNIEAAW